MDFKSIETGTRYAWARPVTVTVDGPDHPEEHQTAGILVLVKRQDVPLHTQTCRYVQGTPFAQNGRAVQSTEWFNADQLGKPWHESEEERLLKVREAEANTTFGQAYRFAVADIKTHLDALGITYSGSDSVDIGNYVPRYRTDPDTGVILNRNAERVEAREACLANLERLKQVLDFSMAYRAAQASG